MSEFKLKYVEHFFKHTFHKGPRLSFKLFHFIKNPDYRLNCFDIRYKREGRRTREEGKKVENNERNPWKVL